VLGNPRVCCGAVTARVRAVLLTMLAAWLGGCSHTKDPCTPADLSSCIVDHIEFIGNKAIPNDVLEEKIATGETGGTFENVPIIGALDAISRTDERYDRFVFERDLARIERLYRSEGYYQAKVTGARARKEPLKDDHGKPPFEKMSPDEQEAEKKHMRVLLDVVIDEGPQVKLTTDPKVVFAQRDASVKDDLAKELEHTAHSSLRKGGGFTEDKYEEARRNITRTLTDAGYAYAHVDKVANIGVAAGQADVTYTVSTGPLSTFGKIEIVGLAGIPEWLIRPMLGFKEGGKFSTNKLEEAQLALSELNIFGSISIDPATSVTGTTLPSAVPIRITVERAKKGSIKLGAGAEAGDEVAVRGVVGWSDVDLFGILDHINIELRPRLVFYPLKLNNLFSHQTVSILPIPEFAARAQYTLPIPLDPKTRVFSQGEVSVSRPANAQTPDNPTEDQSVLGYQSLSGQWGLQRKFFKSRFLVFPSFNMQYFNPFSYNHKPLDGLKALMLRNLELYLELDLRRGLKTWDSVHTLSGFYASVDTQVGGYFLGGDASDVRVRPEIRFYIPLWRHGVLAARAGTGLLFAHNYGKVLDHSPATADIQGAPPAGQFEPSTTPFPVQATVVPAMPPPDQNALNAADRDVQILQIRGLFSGGPSSNRGYGFNEISPHRVLDDQGFPLETPESIGGRTEWDASIELRVYFNDALGGVIFVDSSDVTAGFAQYRITHPHISTGLGIRYDTPVGPLRVDLGTRIPGLQVIGETDTSSCVKQMVACPNLVIDEGDPTTLFTLPIALAIAIGNAF